MFPGPLNNTLISSRPGDKYCCTCVEWNYSPRYNHYNYSKRRKVNKLRTIDLQKLLLDRIHRQLNTGPLRVLQMARIRNKERSLYNFN